MATVQTAASTPASTALAGLDAQQRANAATITAVGKKLGASARDIAVAIMTAMDESSLHNDSGGDRDSAGLFQQRPSQGWGTYAQVTDPTYATTTFFQHLLSEKGRNKLSPWMESQSVQNSGYPDGSNYERYWTNDSNGFETNAVAIASYETGLPATTLASDIKTAAAGGGSAAGSGTTSTGNSGASAVTQSLLGIPNPFNIGTDVKNIAVKLAFGGAGLVMVVLGAYSASRPARDAASQTVQTVAPLAAAAA